MKLAAGDPVDIADDSTHLVESFLGKSVGPDELVRQAQTFAISCEGFPRWAVQRAIKNFVQGKVADFNPGFLPTPAQLAQEVNRIAQPYRTEAHTIGSILRAEVYNEVPPEERERMIKRFDALLAELRANGKLQGEAA